LLLMSAGSVLYMTGKRKCTDLGGLFRTMPYTTICGIVGALSISSFPLTSGFVSKSLISTAAGLQHLELVWYLLAAASAGVFLHAGIKFPWFVFFQKDSGLRPDDPPWNMRAAMVLFAALCIGIGVVPGPLYAILPFAVDFAPYAAYRVVGSLQLLLFSGLAFFLMLDWLKRTLTITLDVDWFYRKLGLAMARSLDRWAGTMCNSAFSAARRGARGVLGSVQLYLGPDGILGRTWPTGSMAFWTTIMLAAYLVLSYL
jgi:multicomponent Na+:H+ antiporter subunit D